MVNDIETRLKELLYEKAIENEWTIKSLEVMPDHAHVFISVSPRDAPQHVVSQLKGFTARFLRLEFEDLKRKFTHSMDSLLLL